MRPRARDQPAQAQDRPRRAPRPVGRRRHRHPARPRRRDDLPGRRQALHTTTATRQRKGEISTWKAHARLRRQDGGRSRRPRDARPDLAEPDLRGRRRRDRLDARRSRRAYDVPLPAPASPSARSSTPTRRSTRPSTRRRRGSTCAQAPQRAPELAIRRTSSRSCCTPATTRTT
jgi:hypothetical protein